MKADVTAKSAEEVVIQLDLQNTIPTQLGAPLTLFDPANKTFLTLQGRSTQKQELLPRIEQGLSTLLSLVLTRAELPTVGTTIELRIPIANFADTFAWPATAELPASEKAEDDEPVPEPRVDLDALSAAIAPPMISARSKSRSGMTIAIAALLLLAALLAAFGAGSFYIAYHQNLDNIQFGLNQNELSRTIERDREANKSTAEGIAKREASLAAQQRDLESGKARAAGIQARLDTDLKKLRDDQAQLEADRKRLTGDQQQLQSDREQLTREQRDVAAARTAVSSVPAPTPQPQAIPAPPPPTAPNVQPAADANSAIVTACDRLAGNPTDQRRNKAFAGVVWSELNTSLAIESCQRAATAAPGNQRVAYQLARALQKVDGDKAKLLLQDLIAKEYPAAFDNLAALLTDYDAATVLWRKGASLGDPDAMYTLADQMFKNKISEAYSGEAFDLLQRADQGESIPARKTLTQLRTNANYQAMAVRWLNGAKIAIEYIRPLVR